MMPPLALAVHAVSGLKPLPCGNRYATRVMRARLRHLSGGLGRGYAELGQEAAVVGLHPLLGQPPVVVVPEDTDHFPLEVLTGGLDWTDGRVGKDPGEVTGERGARGQEPAVHDDLLADEWQASESDAQGAEVRAELIEAQVAAGRVENVVRSEVGAECGVVCAGDRF